MLKKKPISRSKDARIAVLQEALKRVLPIAQYVSDCGWKTMAGKDDKKVTIKKELQFAQAALTMPAPKVVPWIRVEDALCHLGSVCVTDDRSARHMLKARKILEAHKPKRKTDATPT